MSDKYSQHEADYIDRLIRSALCAAAEKLPISSCKKADLLKRIRQKKQF